MPNEPWEKESLAVIATSTALETQFLSHFLHGEDEEDIDEPLRRLRQFRESFDVLSHPVV